jgi:guanylate cyclase soluble subunit alpha
MILARLGRHVIAGCNERLERAFLCLGPDMQSLLTSLDGVHDVLQQSSEDENHLEHEPEHVFVCGVAGPGELELGFSTPRRGVALLLAGSLAELALRLHGTQVKVRTQEKLPRDQSGLYHFRLSITLLHIKKTEEKIQPPVSSSASDLCMSVETMCKAFPWHFILDRRLEIIQLGSGFMRLFGPHLPSLGRHVGTYFEFTRPRVPLQFDAILQSANSPFLLVIRKVTANGTRNQTEVNKNFNSLFVLINYVRNV